MKSSLFILLALAMTTSAYAQQSTTTEANTTAAKASDLQKPEEKVQEDPEQQITNARLRAEAGSKSKFSVKTSLTYNGGSLEKPLSEERPNYASASRSYTLLDSNLDGAVSLAYRATQQDAIRFGTGLKMMRPLHNTSSQLENNVNERGNRILNISSPYLEYSRSFRSGKLQQQAVASVTYATEQSYSEGAQMNGYLTAVYTLLGQVGESKFQPGITGQLLYWGYKDGAQASDTKDTPNVGRTDYQVGVFPFFEYQFNDTFAFRTVFRYTTFSHYRNDDSSQYLRGVSTQSAGVSVALGKTGWIYPNVQWVPEDTRVERTNVGLSTVLNIF